jgi:hypothetical protein
VRDKVAHAFGSETDDRQTGSESLQDDLTLKSIGCQYATLKILQESREKVGVGITHKGFRPTRKRKHVGRCKTFRQLDTSLVAHEHRVEAISLTYLFRVLPRRPVTNKHEPASLTRQAFESLEKEAKVLLPRESTHVKKHHFLSDCYSSGIVAFLVIRRRVIRGWGRGRSPLLTEGDVSSRLVKQRRVYTAWPNAQITKTFGRKHPGGRG